MNKDRREKLRKIAVQIETLAADFRLIVEEEQEAYDNMPEGLQGSDKGNEMIDRIGTLEAACDSLDTVVDEIAQVVDQ